MSLSRREWVSFALLSIVVPVGLLTTFRLTGVLQEPSTPETINVDAVYWNMNRPTNISKINEEVDSSYSDDVASISFGVDIDYYIENDPTYGGPDVLWFKAIVAANVTKDSASLVIVRFSRTDADAILDIDEDPDTGTRGYNIEIDNIKDPSTDKYEAYIEAHSLRSSTYHCLEVGARWFFFDQNDVDHQLTITLEFTYFDSMSYRQIVMPVLLEMMTK